jgi:hypothetical protein
MQQNLEWKNNVQCYLSTLEHFGVRSVNIYLCPYFVKKECEKRFLKNKYHYFVKGVDNKWQGAYTLTLRLELEAAFSNCRRLNGLF